MYIRTGICIHVYISLYNNYNIILYYILYTYIIHFGMYICYLNRSGKSWPCSLGPWLRLEGVADHATQPWWSLAQWLLQRVSAKSPEKIWRYKTNKNKSTFRFSIFGYFWITLLLWILEFQTETTYSCVYWMCWLKLLHFWHPAEEAMKQQLHDMLEAARIVRNGCGWKMDEHGV